MHLLLRQAFARLLAPSVSKTALMFFLAQCVRMTGWKHFRKAHQRMHRHCIQSGCITLASCLQRPASGSAAHNARVCSRQQEHVLGCLSASSKLISQVHQKSLCFVMQNALKWDQVHVIGHSMGAMVATQLASMHPDRLLSLTLISVTAGRWQSIPTNWAAIKYAWQVSSPAINSDPAFVHSKQANSAV